MPRVPRAILDEIQAKTGHFEPTSRLANLITIGELYRLAPKYLTGVVADIGCGKKPYAPLLRGIASEHIGVDHEESYHGLSDVDRIGTAYDTGLPADSCDNLLCTAVLEHLEEPEKALQEAYRILKPGGHAVYGIPFMWPVHEAPRDFYRYSPYGIRHLCAKTGFEVIEIKPLAGYFVTVAQYLSFGMAFFNKGLLKRMRVVEVPMRIMQDLSRIADRLFFREEYAWAYLLVARKPQHKE